jgi:hypothetical protein
LRSADAQRRALVPESGICASQAQFSPKQLLSLITWPPLYFCVFVLVAAADLRKLHPCLSQCSSLWELNLSHNLLPSSALIVLGGLGGGGSSSGAASPSAATSSSSSLRVLNLSYNRLDSLGSLPACLPALTSLRLEGNALAELDDLSGGVAALRTRCPNLRALWLRDPASSVQGSGGSNPLVARCGNQYRARVLAALPSLTSLDGAPRSSDFFPSFERLEADTAQYATPASAAANKEQSMVTSDQPTRAIIDWFPGSQSSWPAVRSEDVEADLGPKITGVRHALRECAAILAEQADPGLAELEKRYGGGAERTAAAIKGGGPREEGSFGFGDDD